MLVALGVFFALIFKITLEIFIIYNLKASFERGPAFAGAAPAARASLWRPVCST